MTPAYQHDFSVPVGTPVVVRSIRGMIDATTHQITAASPTGVLTVEFEIANGAGFVAANAITNSIEDYAVRDVTAIRLTAETEAVTGHISGVTTYLNL